MGEELADRFGPPPAAVLHLLDYGRIKFMAQKLRVQSIDRVEGRVVFKFDPAAVIPPERWTGLIKSRGARLTPKPFWPCRSRGVPTATSWLKRSPS